MKIYNILLRKDKKMNNCFLEKIDGTFTIDEIKNFMRIAYKSNLSIYNIV